MKFFVVLTILAVFLSDTWAKEALGRVILKSTSDGNRRFVESTTGRE